MFINQYQTIYKKLIFCIILCCFNVPGFAAVAYITEVNKVDFGELLGLAGSCHLDHSTKVVTDVGGSLCPFTTPPLGEPGKYFIVADPFKQISIRIKNRPNTGDGLTYVPDGVYEVFGLADTAIISNQFQVIDSGATGVINIKLGGTLTSATSQSFNSVFSVVVTEGITFNELP